MSHDTDIAIAEILERIPHRYPFLLRMEVNVVFHRRGIFKFHGRASVGDNLAAEADFAAMLVETG